MDNNLDSTAWGVSYSSVAQRALNISEQTRRPGRCSQAHICRYCGQGFTAQRNMTRHLKNRHRESRGQYRCQICDRACATL